MFWKFCFCLLWSLGHRDWCAHYWYRACRLAINVFAVFARCFCTLSCSLFWYTHTHSGTAYCLRALVRLEPTSDAYTAARSTCYRSICYYVGRLKSLTGVCITISGAAEYVQTTRSFSFPSGDRNKYFVVSLRIFYRSLVGIALFYLWSKCIYASVSVKCLEGVPGVLRRHSRRTG